MAGRVLDSKLGVVPFATVVLVAADDSVAMDTGRADEQGAYLMKAKRAGQYQVLATAVGFRKGRTVAFTVGTGSVRVLDLRLLASAQLLGEVQVVGRKPLLEMQAEGQAFGVSWQGGLRGEWTSMRAVSRADGRMVERSYGQLFLSLDRTIYKAMGLNLAYSRRIDRPSYQDLNPSIVYLDPYTSQRGNPFLKPQFTNDYKLVLTY